MENYKRGKRVEHGITRESIPIPDLSEDFVWIQVSPGSKMRNILSCAVNSMKEDKQVVWTGVGTSIGKAVSCAEILKRKYDAFQITKICFKEVDEHWEPRSVGLDPLIVKREIPVIHILVSKQGLNVNEPGYQSPADYKGFWERGVLNPKPRHERFRSKSRRRDISES